MLSVNQHCRESKAAAACPTGLCHLGLPEVRKWSHSLFLFCLQLLQMSDSNRCVFVRRRECGSHCEAWRRCDGVGVLFGA